MKKIGIITLTGYNNYGNRLQNLALQRVLIKLGFETKTVIFKKKPIQRSLKAKIGKVFKQLKGQSIFKFTHMIIQKIGLRVHRKLTAKLENERVKRIKEFSLKTISEFHVNVENSDKGYPTLVDFDYFVAGSDQVWNPHLLKNRSQGDYFPFDINFLKFAPQNKRVAYSASFGVSEISDQYTEKYIEYLKGMNFISVREDDGAAIVKKLINVNVPVLVDPTLLLDQSEWQEISSAPSIKLYEKYILTYFLGGISETNDKMIKHYAKSHNLKIQRLLDPKDKQLYTLNPGEFLYMIDHCEMLLTDSFHGCVFAIQFEKPFVVFDRMNSAHSMESRINTLLMMFKLENRKWSPTSTLTDYEKIDFSFAKDKMKIEKEKAHHYLVKSLKAES